MVTDATCDECGREFDLSDELDAQEWHYGHDCEADEAKEIAGLQALIDAGTWGLEGSMGRAMMACIEAGACILGPNGARDYWGNYIPSRTEVQPGTKGSVEYAAKMREAS